MIGTYGGSRGSEEIVASATSIVVKSDLARISGSTQIETILSPLNVGQGIQMIWLTPTAGTVVLGTSGNILVGQSMAQNRIYSLIWSSTAQKWYVHAVA